jgi:N-acetylornithine carbamoyltransferase
MNFLKTNDFTRAALEKIIESAIRIKNGDFSAKPLAGKSVALVFFNPSLRTRASMQVGVLERYAAAIGVRTFAELKNWNLERTEPVLSAFARYASKPVINLESAMHHPCQAMADMMTIRERFGDVKKKVLLSWAWHPKPLPMAVPNSFALAAAQFGHDLRIAHPPGYELDDDLLEEIKKQSHANGGSVEIVNEANAAYDGAEVVYAKSWGSKNFYGAAARDVEFRAALRNDWIVDESKMARTREAIFMHCLPVRRNVIVTDGVIDSPRSVVIDEAENRLHVQKAIMAQLLGN